MNSGDALLALYWTTSGPVEVHGGREWSLFDLADRCEQAARAGFKGIGLWHADLEHVLETRSLADVKRLLDDNGLEYLELECLLDWFLDPDDERRRAADSDPRAPVRGGRRARRPPHQGREHLQPAVRAAAADRALRGAVRRGGRSGTARGWSTSSCRPDVNVQDLDTALAVVEGAGTPNAAVAIDTWHMAKLGIQPDELRAHPAAACSAGSSSATGTTGTSPIPSTRRSTTARSPARASSRSASTSPPRATPATTGRGASRSCPRSSARSRSTRSSTAPTRRRARSSQLARPGAGV